MEDLSLHILDLVENSLAAKARNVAIRLREDPKADLLILEIEDDGEGMEEEKRREALSPFFTTKGKKTGLGLALLAQSAQEAGGRVELESREGRGTKVKATFRLSHVDRRPVGDVEETLRCLRGTHPEVNISFAYDRSNGGGRKS